MTSPLGQPRPVRAPAGSQAFLDIVAAAVPPRPVHDHSRPMCAAWDDHRTPATAPPAMPDVSLLGKSVRESFEAFWRSFTTSRDTQQDYRAVEGPR